MSQTETTGTPIELDLAISPCPNDTFIFHHLIHQTAELLGPNIKLKLELADVEELNRRALEPGGGRHAITKLSFFAMSRLRERYTMLHNGGALGRGCGPLLISGLADPAQRTPAHVDRVLIPGQHTTANLLTHLFLAERGLDLARVEFEAVRYEQIIPALQSGRARFGIIIHEERFTYQAAGLFPVQDLGEWWEQTTGLPIPLGCIAIRNDVLDALPAAKLEQAIRASIDHAYRHPEAGREFIRCHAQALQDDVIQAHIDLYVNDFSRDLGTGGERAVQELFRRAGAAGI